MTRRPLSDVVMALESGRRPPGGVSDAGDVLSIGAEHLDGTGTVDVSKPKRVSHRFYRSLTSGRIALHDILIVKDGATTGKIAFVDRACGFDIAAVNEHVFRMQVDPNVVEARFVYHYLVSPGGQASILRDFRGATVGGISRGFMERVLVPLPSLPEQRRIAAILDKADAIRRKRQQAVRLADDLLRSAFLDMFGDLVANPRGWETKRLGTLITDGPQNGLYRPATDYGTGIPIVRIDSFSDGEIRYLVGLKRVQLDAETAASYRLAENDILINRVNAPNLVGKSAIVPQLSEPTVFESNMMRLRVDARFILAEFLVAQLQTAHVRRQILKGTKDAVNQSSINQDDVRSFELRVPPLDAQQRFLAVKRQAVGLRMQLRESLQRSSFLFASLVHRAFQDGAA